MYLLGVTQWKGSLPCSPLLLSPLTSAPDHELNLKLSTLATHSSHQGPKTSSKGMRMVAAPASDSGAPSLPSRHPAEVHVRVAQLGAEDASSLQTGCFLGTKPDLGRLEGTSETRAEASKQRVTGETCINSSDGGNGYRVSGVGGPRGAEGQQRLRSAGWSHGSGSSKLS